MIQNQKGSASAPTLPSRGSNPTPPKGSDMNKRTSNTDSAERLPLHGRQSVQIDLDALDQMGVGLLKSLYCDIHTLNDVLSGMLNRPCHQSSERSYELNVAGSLLDDLHEFLGVYEQAIINAVRTRRPTDPIDVFDRGNLLIRYEAGCDENLLDIASMALQFAKQEADAKAPNRRVAA
ncbi:hypothetical protein [Nitratireductor rhodophyticola]|uniref:hypothetical protein n=1 Tax=Nitratireductor rhodophyticola TaxID=2854036 RepID=UPI003009ED1B